MNARVRSSLAGVILLVVALSGCSSKQKTYPVSGTVKFADGTPLTSGTVEFASEEQGTKGLNSRGTIQEDGTFKMKTWIDNKEMDGAVEGLHWVVVIPPAPTEGDLESTPEAPFDERFRTYGESGLTFTVKPGAENRYEIVVEKKLAE